LQKPPPAKAAGRSEGKLTANHRKSSTSHASIDGRPHLSL
jgi:hypothetical protein